MDTPDDPIGTVRASEGVLAVRAPSTSIDPEHGNDGGLSWFVINISDTELDYEHIECQIVDWPIVYQPR